VPDGGQPSQTKLCLKEAHSMKPRITVITIGVDDLERSLRFYRDGLGLSTDGIIGKEFEHGAVVFMNLSPCGRTLTLSPHRPWYPHHIQDTQLWA
jgi:catechol 2,3-dioxygenase-like lactoylglutathione lyase family enzyme